MPDYFIVIIQYVVGGTCLGVFVFIAIAAVCSVVGWVKIDPEIKPTLYKIVIVAIVSACVGYFTGFLKLDPRPLVDQLDDGKVAERELVKIETSKTATVTDTKVGETPVVTPAPSVELTPRIYIQVADSSQQELANKAQATLRDDGYLAPGIERVGTKAPANTELRYFLPEEKMLAEKISAQLEAIGIRAPAKLIPGFEDANIRQHHFELWFSKSAS